MPSPATTLVRLSASAASRWTMRPRCSRMPCRKSSSRARKLYDDEAKERMKVRKGKQAGATVVNLPQLDQGRSRDKAGKALGVFGTLVDHATKVLKNAV